MNYEKSKKYWEKVPANVNGVLGGYETLSAVDVLESQTFLKSLLKDKIPMKTVAGNKVVNKDIGAGIGRISLELLRYSFEQIVLIEQNELFLKEAELRISSLSNNNNQFHCCCVGIQDWVPCHMFDVIWCQWVLGYLNDIDLVIFLKKCQSNLKSGGWIVVKENMSSSRNEVDPEDGCITRTEESFLRLFRQSGLTIVQRQQQKQFPLELYPVVM
jgi:protein N-terminal methyltransferase